MTEPYSTSPVASTRPKWADLLGWALLIVGGIIIAGSCFDKGVTDLDDTRITQQVCSDLPQNDPRVLNGDCVTSREALDQNDGIDNPVPFVIGGLMMLAGLSILMGIIWKRPQTYVNR